VNWIKLLAHLPDLDLLESLPNFLDGLLSILSEEDEETKKTASECLKLFLAEIGASSKQWKVFCESFSIPNYQVIRASWNEYKLVHSLTPNPQHSLALTSLKGHGLHHADTSPHRRPYYSTTTPHSPSKIVVKTMINKGRPGTTGKTALDSPHQTSPLAPIPQTSHSPKPRYHAISHDEYYSGEPDKLKYMGSVKPPRVDYCSIIALLLPHCGSERM
jgi:hypothetical protein